VAGAVAVAALGASPAQAAVSAAKTTKLRILVTDDDGPTTPGIDALIPALRKLPNVEVVVAMPATNQSGKGDSTTPGARTGVQTTTPGGYPAYAVDGTPADTVAWALANLKRPQVVVSGVNDGQNLGAITKISGTVGAARTAARAGIPALAVSQGLGNPVPYGVAAQYALQWVKSHRGLILKPKRNGPVLFENLNVPTCTARSIRGQVTVPVAPTATNAVSPADCTSTMTRPADDITAFLEGYVALSPLTAS
jgi:5'-nucleotidase